MVIVVNNSIVNISVRLFGLCSSGVFICVRMWNIMCCVCFSGILFFDISFIRYVVGDSSVILFYVFLYRCSIYLVKVSVLLCSIISVMFVVCS